MKTKCPFCQLVQPRLSEEKEFSWENVSGVFCTRCKRYFIEDLNIVEEPKGEG